MVGASSRQDDVEPVFGLTVAWTPLYLWKVAD